ICCWNILSRGSGAGNFNRFKFSYLLSQGESLMSVNRKIFGLASAAAVFAGMAYGQTALNCAAPTLSPTNPIELRSEGATELVSDTVTTCAASGVAGGINGNVTAFIQGSGVQGITSKALTGGNAGFSDA